MILQDVFQGRQFVLDLPLFATYKEKQLLKEKITKNNGIISYTVTRKTDYIIRNTADDGSSYRVRIAAKYGVRVVTEAFVDACLEKGKLVDSKLHLLNVDENNIKNQFADGKIVTMVKDVQHKSRGSKLSQVKTWLYKDRDGPTFHNDPYVVVKAIILKGKEKQMGHPFCIIEIHCSLANDSECSSYLKFCVFTHQGVLPIPSNAKHVGTKTCRFVETSTKALNVFEQLNKLYTYPPHSMTGCKILPNHDGLGSDQFHVEDWLLSSVLFEPKVAQFVTDIWTEAAYVLDSILSVPLKSIQESQIVQGEGLLLDISKALKNNDSTETLDKLSKEYYLAIPHQTQNVIKTWSTLMHEYNFCQLMKDMVFLQESVSLSDQNITEQQYFSLHCSIQVLDSNAPEYQEVESLILDHKDNLNVNMYNIYQVHRSCEDVEFIHTIGNKKLLLHGSKVENIVGILSRGMLLSMAVCPQQTNMDNDSILGSGLYFSNELTAATKYATASKTNGKRLLLVSEVALGESYEVFSSNPKLTSPPDGYNSVHGVKRREPDITSEFDNNEYVVYNVNQQRIKYIVEFSLPGDMATVDVRPPTVDPNIFRVDPWELLTEESENITGELTVSTFDLQQFLIKYDREVTPKAIGLQSQANEPIPLKSVHVRAKLIDLAAEVVVMQEYRNDTSSTIEARYVFPLDDKAAVCGFEAFANGQHFIGRIEEKKEAQEEYKQAVESGKRAYLMDEEAPDVFKVSIGNVQPHSTVLVKIQYVAELDLEGELVSFRLPGAVSPWQQQLGFEPHLQSEVKTVDVSQSASVNSSVELFVEMPFDIKTLYSPTHQVKTKKTAAHAVVTMNSNADLSNGFQLLVGLSEIHVPRMWVENHPESDSSACMLTFYPEFVSDVKHDIEVILALDASNSMSGKTYTEAQQLAILCLHYLPPGTKFNVLVFGTIYTEAFPTSLEKSVEEVYAAQQFILQSQPVFGSSKISHFLQSYFHLRPQRNTLRSIYVISDGHLQQVDFVFQNAAKHNNHTRIFCLGVGQYVNNHFLNKIAHAGGGAYEYFDDKRKSKWASKVQSQMLKSEEPVLTDIRVEWQQFENNDSDILQAPQQITSVFSGNRLTVYGFVSSCSLAILKGNVSGSEVSTMVFTSELGKSTGTTLHGLTTRAIVRDWEKGFLHQDRVQHEVLKQSFESRIVALSKQYNIITPLTSFVAIEDKDNQPISGFESQPTIGEFVQAECVDFLKYLEYQTISCEEVMPIKGGRGLGKGGAMRHRKIRQRSRSPDELRMRERSRSRDEPRMMETAVVDSLDTSLMEEEISDVEELLSIDSVKLAPKLKKRKVRKNLNASCETMKKTDNSSLDVVQSPRRAVVKPSIVSAMLPELDMFTEFPTLGKKHSSDNYCSDNLASSDEDMGCGFFDDFTDLVKKQDEFREKPLADDISELCDSVRLSNNRASFRSTATDRVSSDQSKTDELLHYECDELLDYESKAPEFSVALAPALCSSRKVKGKAICLNKRIAPKSQLEEEAIVTPAMQRSGVTSAAVPQLVRAEKPVPDKYKYGALPGHPPFRHYLGSQPQPFPRPPPSCGGTLSSPNAANAYGMVAYASSFHMYNPISSAFSSSLNVAAGCASAYAPPSPMYSPTSPAVLSHSTQKSLVSPAFAGRCMPAIRQKPAMASLKCSSKLIDSSDDTRNAEEQEEEITTKKRKNKSLKGSQNVNDQCKIENDEQAGEWQEVKKGYRNDTRYFAKPLSFGVIPEGTPGDSGLSLEWEDGTLETLGSSNDYLDGLDNQCNRQVKNRKVDCLSRRELREVCSRKSAPAVGRPKQTRRRSAHIGTQLQQVIVTANRPTISSVSLGAGLPFFSSLLKRMISHFGFTNERGSLKEELEEMVLHADTDDDMYVPLLDEFNAYGAVELDNLPENWNQELWMTIMLQLESNGLKSLGVAVHDAILSLIATMIIVLHMCREIDPQLLPLDLSSSSAVEKQVSKIAEGFQGNKYSFINCVRVINSLLYITSVNQRHPLVYHTLELGNSWEEALHLLTGGQNLLD